MTLARSPSMCGCGARPASALADEVATSAPAPFTPPGEKYPREVTMGFVKDTPGGCGSEPYKDQHREHHAHVIAAFAVPPSEKKCCFLSLKQASLLIAIFFTGIAIGFLVIYLDRPAKNHFHQENERTVDAAYSFFAIFAGVKILLSILLFFGIIQERTDLIRPWLISYFVVCPVEVCALLTSLFLSILADWWFVALGLSITTVLYSVVYGLCLYVVYNYYISISEITILNV